MTGLDTDNDSIIEIATVVTDAQLNVLAEGPEFIHHPLETLEAMDEWNRNQHRRSGLWQRVVDSTTTLAQAEADRELPGAVDPGWPVADVRELDLPGPSLPAPPDAAPGEVLPLPQPGRVHGEGAGQRWAPTVAPAWATATTPR